MFQYLVRKPGIGLDIQPSAVRMAAVAGNGTGITVISARTTELPEGMINDDFGALNIHDQAGLSAVVRGCPNGIPLRKTKQIALSLPDSVFRVQTLEFDQLPGKHADIERLVRWRLDKTAAFDTADTVLRWQISKRQDKGFLMLASAVKAGVLSQYESVSLSLGLEPWTIGLASFHTLNFYYPYITTKTPVFAFAHVSNDSFATVVVEREGARFYRFKEIKRSGADDVQDRLVRELEDSIHFYLHMDRRQPSEVGHFYLAGDAVALDALASGLREAISLESEVLSPAAVLGPGSDTGPEMAAALGAGWALR